MKISKALLTALVLCNACATYKEYTCPAPIGKIVRDDCAVYETRHDALSVDLGFTFKGIGVSAKVSQDKLQNASELVQILKHQSLSLCRDFNSCRIATADYQSRRERIDHNFTAVTAISEQLKNPAINDDDRHSLIDRLIALFDAPGTDPKKKRKRPPKPWKDPFYRARKAKIVPPAPKQVAAGVPRLVGVHVYPRTWPKAKTVNLTFEGFVGNDIQDDDFVELHGRGVLARCPVRRTKHGGRAKCSLKGPLEGAMTIQYRPGSTEALSNMGEFLLDPGWIGGRAWLAYETVTDDATGAETHERPYLVVYATTKKTPTVYARCKVNGRPIGAALKGGRSKHAFFAHRFALPLPFAVRTAEGPVAPPDAFSKSKHAGKWTCEVSAEGQKWQHVEFAIDGDGRTPLDEDALENQGAFRPGWFPVSVRAE